MIIERLTVGPFQENTYLLAAARGGEAFAIDPGGETDLLLQRAEEADLSITAIVNTHGHIDHIAGAAELSRRLDIPFRLHDADRFLLDGVDEACAMFGLPPLEAPELGPALADGEILRLGELAIEVIHTPGHSPGSVTFHAEGHLFVGDVLFAGSIGRTDLPGGDFATLMRSIFHRLVDRFPGPTRIHPGHGPESSLAEEMASNPFLLTGRPPEP
jgi:glyoxylase-like metal-dependent hydrolase (beta-lactamase superfamily II)